MPVTINGTTGIAGVDGSASTPAVQGSDTNTGEFFPAADTIAWTTGGSERMRVDSSGNVGIGTSSPTSGKLVINGTSVTTSQGIRLVGDTADARFICESATLGAGILGTFSNHNQLFYTNSTERMRLDSSGNLIINGTSTSWTNRSGFIFPSSSGDSTFLHDSSKGDGTRFIWFVYNGGQIGSISQSGTTAVSYNTTSDYRLKENVQPMTTGLSKISALKPITYDWISDKSAGEGFIAHELQAVIPNAVTGEKDAVDANGNPIHQGVDYSKIVVHLVAAVQELSAKVDAQAAEIAALKANAPA